MATFLSNATPKLLLSPSNSTRFPPLLTSFKIIHLSLLHSRSCNDKPTSVSAASYSRLKENWLGSLSCPFVETGGELGFAGEAASGSDAGPEWVVGIDPDISGALAILKGNADSGFSAQVFDTPRVQVSVGRQVRKRLDARSIVELLRSFDAPLGTVAYIEQSNPFPKDGKQGWWSGGFGFGLWIGILVASGFTVVPVPPLLWKNQFDLPGRFSSKDDSRKAASTLFPTLSPLLKRKKDHGRAEALLIAAYGKGLKLPSESCNGVMQSVVADAVG